MRYSSSHKEETRRKLIESSRAIAKEDGFASTGIDALMASIGLTGAAFYNHFPSKQALFEALVSEEASNSADLLATDASAPDGDLAKRLRSYLSTHHVQHPESGCALPTLGPEIARATPAARAEVEKSLKRIQKSWSSQIDNPEAAWAVMAQCVGALVLARTVAGERTRRDILVSSRRFLAEALGLDNLK
ncbi:MAG: TetR/AcrR family transcriptional regulator [Paraburkholderia sp.]|uniref:TetR/AcrR family transcriptional regulator n=1 Tax=Paraburkholderia sp. TaxID=1926495 RepID=UPI00121A5D4A|nr:TetR/AcrR family transcriptional regulator [Paraburkholderia sp.]TAM05338.1 MAG: TetR/AcrR family transcriptional regulator [Paraburkholderia sp.]